MERRDKQFDVALKATFFLADMKCNGQDTSKVLDAINEQFYKDGFMYRINDISQDEANFVVVNA